MNAPNTPLYSGCCPPRNVPDNGHRGLWYERFFNQYDDHGLIYKEDKNQGTKEGKREWIKTIEGRDGDGALPRAASDRLATLCTKGLNGDFNVFSAAWHFATGLGNPHPVENGFLWHPVLAAPYIPGAAVKGLVRSWVEAWMDFDDAAARISTLHRWFGSENKDPKDCKRDSVAGTFIFFDALPIEWVKLKADVMTPHYGDWYEKGGDDPTNPEVTPADWHDPVPIPFLVANKPKFLFAVAPRDGNTNVELTRVMDALTSALEWLGAGAKTAVGYGRLSADEQAKEAICKRIERAAMSAENRMVAEVREFTPKQLAEMFGKDFGKTREDKGDRWSAFVGMVWEAHGELIYSWKKSPDKNKGKTYKKLLDERGLL